MPKLRKRTSRYDQLQTLLYGQIRVQGVKPETLIGCARAGIGYPHRHPARSDQISVSERRNQ